MTAEEIRGAARMARSLATDGLGDIGLISTTGMESLWVDGFTTALAAVKLEQGKLPGPDGRVDQVIEGLVAEAEKAGDL
jgi:hypothetical protein